MTALNVTSVHLVGGLADLAAAAVAASGGGDTAPCGDGRVLVVFNGGASARTVTAVSPGTVNGLAIADPTLTVAAGKTGLLPLPRVLAGPTGRASITYDGVTSVTVAVLDLEA
jgi:hypothetical protein